ncbi:MAG: hypothetical protein E2O54_14290 [Gammaproteobacteria bacterium]|nr:MAG: hypothetical protein E2O54_14290 [Gammaproteobacteria bacterium]
MKWLAVLRMSVLMLLSVGVEFPTADAYQAVGDTSSPSSLTQRFQDGVAAKTAHETSLPQWVQYWMKFMTIVFLADVFFVFHQALSRWILSAVMASTTTGILIGVANNFVGGVLHYVFWFPLVVYIFWSLRNEKVEPFSISGGWVTLTFLTMTTSLVLDAWNIGRHLVETT